MKILVTSRDRLNLTGEQELRLGAMDYPDICGAENLQSYAAVHLLIHYARLSRPDLVIDDRSLEDIVSPVV